MRKGIALLLVLAFLTASFVIAAKPVSAAAPVENSWVSKAPMHVARSDLRVAVVNGKIYAIGGNTQNGVVGVNEVYDPATDTWTMKTPMPTPRVYFASAVYQNKIYCIGGIPDSANAIYDPSTDNWTTKAPMPIPVYAHMSAVIDHKIYILAGGPSPSDYNQIYDIQTVI